jgi:CHAD domain-containing protein
MHEYVRAQTAILLRRLAFQVGRAAKSSDPESIHDLRAAIRRFRRCLRLFSQFYLSNSAKKARHRLEGMMKAAGAVRDLDIALELVGEAGLAKGTALVQRLAEARRKAKHQLLSEVRDWKAQGYSRKWRSSLSLHV